MNRRLAGWKIVCHALAVESPEGSERLRRNIRSSPDDVWTDVVRWADAHLVTPGVWSGLVSKRLDAGLPEDPRRYLSGLHRMNSERNARLRAQLDDVVRELNGQRIVPLLLKGAAYIKSGVYADPGARILWDLDILVEQCDVARAFEALKKAGYSEGTDTAWTHSRHCPKLYHPQCHAAVEIHWRHFKGKCDQILPSARIWERSVEGVESGLRFRLPSATDAVLASILNNHFMDGYGDMFIIGMRPMQDLVVLDASYQDLVDWEAIRVLMESHGEERRFRQYMYAATRLAGAPRSITFRFRLRERLHHSVCLARVRWQSVESLMTRFNGFGSFHLHRKHGPTDSAVKLNLYRARELVQAVRRRFERIEKA